jgi:signal transduction histidine kinase
MTVSDTVSQQAKLAALYEVSAGLGATLDLSQLLNLVMDSIIQLTHAERGFVMLIDPLSGELEVMAARNVDQETIGGESMKISRTVVQQVADSGDPLLANNAQEDDRFANHASVVSFQLRSIMCAPLRARGRAIGVAYVDNRLFSGAFSPADLELLVAFTNQAAVAIENARLFTQTDQELNRRVQELTLFQQLDRELNKSLDLQRALGLALDWAVRLTAADGGSIGLLEEEEEDAATYARLLAFRGLDEKPRETVPASHPILAELLNSQQSVLTDRVTADQSIDGSPAVTQLATPVRAEGRVIGLITLESRRAHAFSPEDVAFVERVADRAAVAIENSRLYETIHAANKAKNDFISLVTHELRVPMTSIKGYTDLILGGLVGPLTDQQREFLETIKRNLQRMNVLISDLSDINRIESGRMNFELAPFELGEAVMEVIASLRESVTARKQTLSVELTDDLPLVYADRTRFSQVLTNLVSNANKYTPDEGQIEIEARQNGEFVVVKVRDNGLGISEADQAHLFTQFFRSDDEQARRQTGWGLGLSIVKKMVEAQGGAIHCVSAYREGSEFSFTVPSAKSEQLTAK